MTLSLERQGITPSSNDPWLFLNAHPLDGHDHAGLVCEQGFRPLFLELEQSSARVAPSIDDEGRYAGTLILTHRSRDLNRAHLMHALARTSPGGLIVVAGEKTSGIASLKKWAAGFVPVVDTFSKFHAQAFVVRAGSEPDDPPTLAKDCEHLGLFGGGKIDAGSQLLARTFDGSISGSVADFCAGTGYLTRELLERSNPTSIALFEAEYRGVEIARRDLDHRTIPLSFHWTDLTSEPVAKTFDWIIMNPPFHEGRAADPSLGQSMIRASAGALQRGGKLRMVANRQLPYENTLRDVFGAFNEIIAESGFKVLQATKRK